MRFSIEGHQFMLLSPPYRRVEALDHPYQIPRAPFPNQGSVLLWNLQKGDMGSGSRWATGRPPGVALFILLPSSGQQMTRESLLRLMATCRPHSILPHVDDVDPEELAAILRRFPSQFAIEITDYLLWRGIEVELDTRRLVRKTLELSGELRTVKALARALYMSRRALGRRFMSRGLPAPSHWLHFGRVLRGAIRLQHPASNIFAIGCELGYPDGFAFSNQMKRLTGLRPSVLRERFGWEWIVETWLLMETQAGSFSSDLGHRLYPRGIPRGASETPPGAAEPRLSPRMLCVAEATGGRRTRD